jgi:UPF0176 protein
MMASPPFTLAALYQFTHFEDPALLKGPLLAKCNEWGMMGTLLLAHEGINGTIAGAKKSVEHVIKHIRSLPGCTNLDVKFSTAVKPPFSRMKIRLKQEIVTMGEPAIDPRISVGHYVSPKDWNELISDPETLVIDTRNSYEVSTGTFKGAIDPRTTSFREFPKWFRENREKILEGKKKVAMFCTGGIRCEKSTSFLRKEGIEDVYHLKGGILKYLENVPKDESLWDGECFVFDERVTVRHGLEQGNYGMCRACRRPVSEEEQTSEDFVSGVSCPHCINERSDEQRARYSERQKQQQLAKKRGEVHVGARPYPRK